MGEVDGSFPIFLDRVVEFPDGKSYELLESLTNLRGCHDGTPAEARILFTCREVTPGSSEPGKEEYVMKIKAQQPLDHRKSPQEPQEGPSTTTADELKALEAFRKANITYTPHLVTWKRTSQGDKGLLPGGYLTFTVMTKMPGMSLLDARYWELPTDERDEITRQFLEALKSIYLLGIEPIDCALRNVLWEPETRKCSIIDFELWREASEVFTDETKELQRWGLARRPPPATWWAEWNRHER